MRGKSIIEALSQQVRGMLRFMRNFVGSLRLKFLIIAMTGLLTLNLPAWGEDRMVLGPRQFEVDKTGNGAVLCTWSAYLSIQAETAACGLTRRPTDDAMDEAIIAIDELFSRIPRCVRRAPRWKNSSVVPRNQISPSGAGKVFKPFAAGPTWNAFAASVRIKSGHQ